MSTIHNPVNFNPQDYAVVGYFDNQPPQFYGYGSATTREERDRVYALWCEARTAWETRRVELFDGGLCHRCVHCGNGNVRYVVSCLHRPSGKRVCFGDICEARLNFPGHDAFAAANIRTKANLDAKRAKLWAKRQKFVQEREDLAAALDEAGKPQHADNNFVKDVLGKLDQYGELSERQIEAVVKSLARDNEFAARRAAREAEALANPPTAPAPTGRVTVEGKILSVREDQTPFGLVVKMLVELTTRCKVWCTVPTGCPAEKEHAIKFTATFTRSDRDQYFSFGKRPHLVSYS